MTNKTLTLVLTLAICTVTGLMAMQLTTVFAMGNATQAGNQSSNQNQ
jgi:hypothetical protein